MLNVLIVEDNVTQCKQLVNFISSSIPNVKLYSMSFSGAEAIEILKSEQIDLIILDLQLPDISGIEILNFIEDNSLNKYKNSVVIVSGYAHLYPNLIHNQYIHNIMPKPVSFPKLLELLKKAENDKKNLDDRLTIMTRINEELKYLCYNFSHIGTEYIRECIFLLYINNINTLNLSKRIYPIIAKKFHTTVNNVKCNIFQASNISYYECEETKLKKYFQNCLDSKPKPKDIIIQILNHINFDRNKK